jgi:hypothetical protein
VTLIGWLFVTAGLIGVVYHLPDLRQPFEEDALLLCSVRLLAIVAGAYILRGRNWARWLALAWMSYHVVLGAFHTSGEFFAHALLLAIIASVLLQPAASRFFRVRSHDAP